MYVNLVHTRIVDTRREFDLSDRETGEKERENRDGMNAAPIGLPSERPPPPPGPPPRGLVPISRSRLRGLQNLEGARREVGPGPPLPAATHSTDSSTSRQLPLSDASADSTLKRPKQLSPYVVQVKEASRPTAWHRATSTLLRRQAFDAKLAALLKHRAVRLADASAKHEHALQNLRRAMFAQRAKHLEEISLSILVRSWDHEWNIS